MRLILIISLIMSVSCVSRSIRKNHEQMCNEGSAQHCMGAANMAKIPGVRLDYYERACSLGLKEACKLEKALRKELADKFEAI